MQHLRHSTLVALAASLALAGCGGGGDVGETINDDVQSIRDQLGTGIDEARSTLDDRARDAERDLDALSDLVNSEASASREEIRRRADQVRSDARGIERAAERETRRLEREAADAGSAQRRRLEQQIRELRAEAEADARSLRERAADLLEQR